MELRKSLDTARQLWSATPATAGGPLSAPATGGTSSAASWAASSQAEQLRTAAEGATPATKVRVQLAILVQSGHARPGLGIEDPDLLSLTTSAATQLVRTVQSLMDRQRAPPLRDLDADASLRVVRLCKLLNHELVVREEGSGMRCAMCTWSGAHTRANGCCRICGVRLCYACSIWFHTSATVSPNKG